MKKEQETMKTITVLLTNQKRWFIMNLGEKYEQNATKKI